jgi:hypothetical protein
VENSGRLYRRCGRNVLANRVSRAGNYRSTAVALVTEQAPAHGLGCAKRNLVPISNGSRTADDAVSLKNTLDTP